MIAKRLSSARYSRTKRVSLDGCFQGKSASGSGIYRSVLLDVSSVLVAAIMADAIQVRVESLPEDWAVRSAVAQDGRSTVCLMAFLIGFASTLIFLSQHLRLYGPTKRGELLREQRLSFQACFIAALLSAGTIHLVDASVLPSRMVVHTLCCTAALLSIRRLMERRFFPAQPVPQRTKRNVLVVGSTTDRDTVSRYIESIRGLDFAFKGFVDISSDCFQTGQQELLNRVFDRARRQFVDEIVLVAPHRPQLLQQFLAGARKHHMDLRIIPHYYPGITHNCPVEYVGHFPTFALPAGKPPRLRLRMKRVMDMVFSLLLLASAAVPMLLIAILIRLDSPGPVFYRSDRIGQRGRVFKCTKFRTMARDAERHRKEILHLNERDGVLFKASNDPRVTRIGRILRKYSLDELPQLFDVIRGDMSLVGPRPPLASEVREYKPSHLRRLDVLPGITGLWQVRARKDPSFDNYISLDLTYIENWSIWLDIKILLSTVPVVLSGTGS